MRKHGFDFRFVHKDKNGEVLEDSGFMGNHVTDDGFELLYDSFFRGASAPDNFAIGLAQNSLGQTDSLGDVMEVTGTGYERQALERSAIGFPSLGLDGGDMEIESATVQFENTAEEGAWDSAVDGFLVAEGASIDDALVCYRPLSATRTLQVGDTLDVTIRVKGLQP